VQWWQGPSFSLPEYRDLVDISSLWASFRRDQAVTEAQRLPSRERIRRAVEHVQRSCARAGVPLIIALPPANLLDHPPFLSAAADGKPLAAHPELSAQLEAARADYREGRWDGGLATLQPLLAAHPGLAEAHHLAGRLHQGAKRDLEARASFLSAWNADGLPLRGDEALLDVIRSTVQTNQHTRVMDLMAIFAEASEGRYKLPSGVQFHDHAHMNFTGHHLAARALVDQLIGLFPDRLVEGPKRRKLSFPGRDKLAKRVAYTVISEYLDRLEGHPSWTGPLYQGLADSAERLEQRQFELSRALEDSTHDPNPPALVEAVKALRKQHPKDTGILQSLVEHLFMDNKLPEVEPLLSELNLRLPHDLRVLDRMRILFSNTERPLEAYEAASRVVKGNPENMMACIYKGVTLKSVTTNVAEVLRYHQELLERFPRAYEVRRNLATAHAVAGDTKTAGPMLLELIRERPQDESPVVAYAEMKTGQGELSEALRVLVEGAQRIPKSAQIRYLSGVVYHRADRLLPALTEMQEALRISSVHAPARQALAELRKIQDQRAKEWFEAAQKLRAAKRYAEAMPLYLKALELFPEGMSLLENVTYLYATCEDPAVRNGAKAVEHADRLLALAATPRFDNYATAAAAYAADGKFARAVELAERAVALAESLPERPGLDKLRQALESYRQARPFLELR
jgi:tetratricopeptide (TPR) repeat protein